MDDQRITSDITAEILVVEDSRVQAEQLKHLLEQNGHQVSVAGNGLEALAHLEKHIPALIISDIVMPEMNGLDAAKEINAKDTSAKILMLTQYDDDENVLASKEAGAVGFIPKASASSITSSGQSNNVLPFLKSESPNPGRSTPINLTPLSFILSSINVASRRDPGKPLK